jgi:hypothetical protein
MRETKGATMPKYVIAWTEENWYNLIIDAPHKTAALDMFYNNEYDREEVMLIGSELQDSLEIEEV